MWGTEELCQLGQAGFWWLIELLVLVGEYVETYGHLIHARRQLKGSDLDLFCVWVGVWAGRLGGRAQVMFQFLSQGFCYGIGLFTRFLRLLGALLLPALALLLGCLQLGWRFLVALSDRLGRRGKATWLFLAGFSHLAVVPDSAEREQAVAAAGKNSSVGLAGVGLGSSRGPIGRGMHL